MTPDPKPDHPDDEELVSADDAVIGRAFRWSVVAILALALIAGLALLWRNLPQESQPEISIERSTPVAVEKPISPPQVAFIDITREAGIDFEHFNGAEGEKLLPESMGSGAAFFDYDGDDDPDLLLINATSWPHSSTAAPDSSLSLYQNDGRGSFKDVTRAATLDVKLYGTGVAVGDIDADGRPDVFVGAVGSNRLFRNLGDRFEDVTEFSGVAGDADTWSTSAAFFDYDNDGDLDLFVCNYVRWSREIDFEIDYRLTGVGRAYGPPTNYEGTFSYLYRNEGDGRFVDVSAESGIQVQNPATGVAVGKALALLPIDVDLDGWIDLFVSNDTVQNFMFHNRGGVFEEAGSLWGLAFDSAGAATGAMGVDAAYYRNDGELAFAIGNFANEMTSLYLSQGDPTLFADEAIIDGIGAPTRLMLSFGLLFFDYDLDGRLDMLQANGHLENEINTVDPSQTYRQASQLFWNAGPDSRRTFVPVAPDTTGDLARPLVGRANAVADIDADGDLDVIITQVAESPLLLRNDQATDHHWLRLQLRARGGNRDAIGARLVLDIDDSVQRRQVMPTRSYLSQSESIVTFGLGDADHYDSLTIVWPDGTEQQVGPLELDRLHTIDQP
ncbi:MAG: CRTAC1 family protein [Acidobacteriota bacterium]